MTLFFLLSGFLLSRQFLTDTSRLSPARIGQFWRRRGLRVLPAYWLAIIGTLWILSNEHSSRLDWTSYLLLVQTYDHHYRNNSLSQTWTLVVELSFYAVLPLLIWLSRRIPRPRHQQITVLVTAMAAAAVAANLFTHFRYGGGSLSLLWLPEYLDWFALGILLASLAFEPTATRWRRMLSEWAKSPGTCWIVGALLFWLVTLPLGRPARRHAGDDVGVDDLPRARRPVGVLLPPPADPGRVVAGPTRCWATRRWCGSARSPTASICGTSALLLAIARWLGWPAFSGHFLELFLLTAARRDRCRVGRAGI